jgi:hypothetical protein
MVAVSGLLLAGATVADTGSLAPLAGAGGVLAVGTAGLTAAAHHAGTLSRWPRVATRQVRGHHRILVIRRRDSAGRDGIAAARA